MSLWPFRRKTGRKRSRSGATLSDAEGGSAPPPRSQTANDCEAAVARPSTLKKRRTEPNKLQRRTRTYSFSPGRDDAIGVSRNKRRADPEPRHDGGEKEPSRRRSRRSKEEEEHWERAPTLHNKQNVPRKKSSKRRREDHDREEEIRAMAHFMPVRPATDAMTAGRPMKKDSKRVKTGLGFGRPWDNPSSDISLPMAGSIHSTLSSDSEYGSYKLGGLGVLAPRPTLRYAVYPRWGPPNGSGPTRTSSQKRRLADRAPIPEATLKAHKRIDDLADDLDASDLRELMERDKRRRERKQQKEQERIERRLARRAEKQRAAEEVASREGSPPPQNLERGVMGRELVGLGIDTTSAVVTSSRRRPSDASPSPMQVDTSTLPKPTVEEEPEPQPQPQPQPTPRPLDKFHRTSSIPLEPQPPASTGEREKSPEQVQESVEVYEPPTPQSPKHTRLLKANKSRSKQSLDATQSRSTASPPPPARLDEIEAAPRKSEGSHKTRLSFSSLFKWGNKYSRRGSGPSSFSNTSREEMQAAMQSQTPPAVPVPAPAPAANPSSTTAAVPMTARKLSGGMPKRTRSRFREDLPELPLSPPDSRMNSPEAEPALSTLAEQRTMEQSSPIPMPGRFGTPTSGHHTMDETMRQTPTSPWQQDASPEPQQSISLASIDSEASWLSGRLTGRRSGLRHHNRTHSHDTGTNSTDDEHAIAEDEYLSRLAPPARHLHSNSHPVNRKSTGEARPSSDEDEPMPTPVDEDMKWGSVSARQQPTMVHAHQDADMAKSREGLLNTYGEDEEDSEAEDTVEHDLEKEGGLQRATSVKLGKGHAKQISAGSAKLLELSPRASIDSRRRSSGAVFI